MKQIYYLIVLLLVCSFFASCEKDTDPEQLAPSVELLELTDMSRTVVTLHGKLIVPDLNSIEEVGFKVGKASDLSDAQLYPAVGFKENLEDVTVEVRGLEVGGTYFYAMYVGNGISLNTSEIQAFTTLTNSPPYPSEVIKSDTARAYFTAKILDDGGAPVTSKGFCWGTRAKPTIFDSFKVIEGSGDDMEIFVPEMKAGITYYIRTFAENANGFTYSKEVMFQLPSPGIYHLNDLLAFRDAVNSGQSIDQWLDEEGTMNLFADIDLASVENWIPIGGLNGGPDLECPFNGNDFVIRNMKMNYSDVKLTWNYAFIGRSNKSIKNLHIENAVVKTQISEAWYYTAGICGNAMDSLNNCSVSGIIEGTGIVGGICADSYSMIKNCKNEAAISGHFMTAGISARIYGMASDCLNTGDITDTGGNEQDGDVTAGIGYCSGVNASIFNCINRGAISGASAVTGIGGIGNENVNGVIEACTNYGDVTSSSKAVVGISLGSEGTGIVRRCINHGNVTHTGTSQSYKGVAGISVGVNEIVECENYGGVSSTTHYADGIGRSKISIISCKNNGKVSGDSDVSGIGWSTTIKGCINKGVISTKENGASGIGYAYSSVENCTNEGTITCGGYFAGGISASVPFECTVLSCLNKGDIIGSYQIAGIAGVAHGSIVSCENQGNITGAAIIEIQDIAGICGQLNGGKVSSCIYGGTVNGKAGTKDNAVGNILAGGVFEP